jgi:hypothetical protein
MIRIIQNPNLSNWFSLIKGETLLEQIRGKANALKLARKLARDNDDAYHMEHPYMISKEHNTTK